MVLVLIGIAVGVILAAILIMKIYKTNSRDVMGMDLHCIKCGVKTGAVQSVTIVKGIQNHLVFNSTSQELTIVVYV